jgi:hypothetical protein
MNNPLAEQTANANPLTSLRAIGPQTEERHTWISESGPKRMLISRRRCQLLSRALRPPDAIGEALHAVMAELGAGPIAQEM